MVTLPYRCANVKNKKMHINIIIVVYFQHLLEENTVCPRRPSLLIGELHLLAWTEQESHACNVNQALDRKQKHFEVIFLSYYSLCHHTLQMSFYSIIIRIIGMSYIHMSL